MKNTIFIALILFVFCSCQEEKSSIKNINIKNLTQTQVDSILKKFQFQYETPIVLDSTHQILIPISTKLLKRKSSFSKEGYRIGDFPRYWNVLFYNNLNEKIKLLTKNKIRISEIYAKRKQYEDEETNKILNGKILYEISDIDYNKDNELNGSDPEFLFVSEIDGTNLKRISPVNEDLVYFKVLSKSKQIILETRRDINNDSIFNEDDQLIWYKAKITNQEWKLQEIVDSLNRKEIEQLYLEQWLKNNNE